MRESANTFGDYVIDDTVGRGGCATVYRAHHVSEPRRSVALKVLDEDHRDPAARARLTREFGFARRLDHPHIIRACDHGPGWLTMQFVGGGKATRLGTVDDRLTALAQIADALDYTHGCGVVHCDVKPANILLTEDFSSGGAVLVDFGVAHAVVDDVWRRQRRPHASLPYAAPEILLGRAPSAATDEYALACTAAELLTGAPPFPGESVTELVDAHLHRPPPALSRDIGGLSRAFDNVLGRAIAKIPESRYQSCTEFVEQLARVSNSGGQPSARRERDV